MNVDNRRKFLATTLATGIATGVDLSVANRALARVSLASNSRERIERFLMSLVRGDGGYAWDDSQPAHLTSTYAVIGAAKLISLELPDRQALVEFVHRHHPATLKSLEQEHRLFTFQQLQALEWLAEDGGALRESVEKWQQPLAYLKQYEQHGYPVFMQEVSVIVSRQLLGLSNAQLPSSFIHYLERHRRDNGSFNNTPASDGSDGNILNTAWGLQALAVLGRSHERKASTISWLQSCQLPVGGFTHQPHAQIGAIDDVAYTWSALRSLKLLASEPIAKQACIEYLLSLWNDDGGFGDRPGWRSNAMATYYALDALNTLGAFDGLDGKDTAPDSKESARRLAKRTTDSPTESLMDKLNVYSIQLEAHGQGSPRDAVLLARDLKIHLWGAKNSKPGWIEQAQAVADEARVPVKFVRANEEYGTWVDVAGMGTYSHMSDIVAPTASDIGPSLANSGVVSWHQFKEQRLANLHRGQGKLIWQFGENEPLVRMLLDDSLEHPGFSAISTFHFGNPDFTNSEPFLNRYRERLPYVALQDAHGSEPWWFADMTEGFRTLFLATEPTWSGFLNALQKNWIVAVRHDAASRQQTWMHGGADAVLDFVRNHATQWQWWDNPAIVRPAASITVLRADELFEVGRPAVDETTLNVRVRCAWRNTAQGLAKEPLYSLQKLALDGHELVTELKSQRRPNGLYEDHYHRARLSALPPGPHKIIATLKRLSDQQTTELTHKFG